MNVQLIEFVYIATENIDKLQEIYQLIFTEL